MSKSNVSPVLIGMVKNATPQRLIKMPAVLSVHIGMDSSVQVMLTHVLKELHGLVITAKQYKRNAKQDIIGLAVLVRLFPQNAQHNSHGTNNNRDVLQSTMFAPVEHITMVTHACHPVDAKMVKFGATIWSNAFAQIIHSGMEPLVLHVWVVCFTMLQDATVLWELSSMGLLVVK